MSRRRGEPGRVKWRLSELLRAAGIEVSPYDFWTQDGGYRHRNWDLARWGAHDAKWIDPINKYSGTLHVYSWDTMTDCVRYGINLSYRKEGEYSTYDPWEVEVHRSNPA
jgi:hypothetical protein